MSNPMEAMKMMAELPKFLETGKALFVAAKELTDAVDAFDAGLENTMEFTTVESNNLDAMIAANAKLKTLMTNLPKLPGMSS